MTLSKVIFKEINETKKEKFKRIMKKHVRISAMRHLKQLQQNHSKAKNIKYDKLELVQYMNKCSQMIIQSYFWPSGLEL